MKSYQLKEKYRRKLPTNRKKLNYFNKLWKQENRYLF